MKELSIVALLRGRFSGSFGRGLRLSEGCFLTTDRAVVDELLSGNLARMIGALELNFLRSAPGVVYSIRDIEEPADNAQILARLSRFLGDVQIFLMYLWLVKDNAVNIELGFSEFPFHSALGSHINSNFRAVRCSNAAGGEDETSFLEDELREARDLFLKHFDPNEVVELKPLARTMPSELNRIERVMYFLQIARGASDLGLKITFYGTCFEALFCTDASEISHKLSERLAYFCASDPASRIEVFRTAKKAYEIRSKTIHGDTIRSSLAGQAPALSAACDDLLRRSLSRILHDDELYKLFSGPTPPIDEFFLKLTLGCPHGA